MTSDVGLGKATSGGSTEAAPIVLHITQCIGGGVPQAILDQVRATPGARHHVMWPTENDPLCAGHDISLFALPAGHLSRYGAIRRLVSSIRPDFVVAHSTWAGVYTRIGRRLAARIYYQPHGLAFANPARNRYARVVYRAAEAALAKRADAIVALTDEEEALARQLGARRVARVQNVSYASSSVDLRARSRVVTVGRISPQKDPLFFAEVSRLVRAALPEVDFVWVGDGDPRLTAHLHGSDVRTTGWLGQQEVWDYVAGASLYLHTAAAEGFPLAVLDAAELRTPLVLRSIPAFASVQDLPLNSVREVAEAVLEALSGRAEAAQMVSARVRSTSSRQSQMEQLNALYSMEDSR